MIYIKILISIFTFIESAFIITLYCYQNIQFETHKLKKKMKQDLNTRITTINIYNLIEYIFKKIQLVLITYTDHINTNGKKCLDQNQWYLLSQK